MKSSTGFFLLLTFFLFFTYQGKPAEASFGEHPLQPDPADFNKFLNELQGISPPQEILVRITGDWPCVIDAPYSLVTMDFNTYVKNVLPNEWYYWWPEESLKAGAVAVKMYAWYWIDRGGKWPDADVTDSTCDQWFSYGSAHPRTDKAVDETWHWVLSQEGDLFETRHKNTRNCSPPNCIQQTESAHLARSGYRWDEILAYFYPRSDLWTLLDNPAGFNLRFKRSGAGHSDHISIPLIDQGMKTGVNVGEVDFTLEWFMKAYAGENHSADITCEENQNWEIGSVIFERDRLPSSGAHYSVSLFNSRIIVGVGHEGNNFTLCGTVPVGDGRWHHIAVQRRVSDGRIWLFVDGELDAYGYGPPGDISFPVGLENESFTENTFIIGAGRRDGTESYRTFSGWLDEIRFSGGLRYPARGFEPPTTNLAADGLTAALFRLDEGKGIHILDSTSHEAKGLLGLIQSSSGRGPHWQISDLFINYDHILYLPVVQY